jgi:hypothetical protein
MPAAGLYGLDDRRLSHLAIVGPAVSRAFQEKQAASSHRYEKGDPEDWLDRHLLAVME